MKNRKLLLVVGIIMLVFCTMCSLNAQFGKKGNGNIVKSERLLGDFNKIEVNGGLDIFIKQGDSCKVIVEIDENLQEKTRTVVEDSVLKIYPESWLRFCKNAKIRVIVKDIKEISGSGGSDIFTEGQIIAGILKVHLSGGSDARINIKAIELRTEANGGSDAIISGAVGYFVANASGGSDIKAFDCVAAKASVNASGGSDIFINVQDEVSIVASGGSDVKYRGTASVIKSQSSGGSDIIKE